MEYMWYVIYICVYTITMIYVNSCIYICMYTCKGGIWGSSDGGFSGGWEGAGLPLGLGRGSGHSPGPPVQLWCLRKELEGRSYACLRSPSREPGFLFFQCLPDVLLSLAGGEAIMFTSKVTSFLEPPDAACFSSCLTDTALHIISLTIWWTRDIDQQLVCFLNTAVV